MRRLAAFTLTVAAVAALTGCGSDAATDPPPQNAVPSTGWTDDGFGVSTVDLPDGRTVTCVVWADPNSAGLSCDWQRAAAPGQVDQ